MLALEPPPALGASGCDGHLDGEGRAVTGMSVEPYREITFDKEGDGPAGQPAALAALARQGLTDLVVFAHGWNSSPAGATRLCSDFFEPFPGLLAPGVEAGYAGVIWPSMMFTGEPVPDYRALVTVLPEKEQVLDRLTELLVTAPADEAAFAEFGALLRELTDVAAGGDDRAAAAAGPREPVPEFLVADPLEVCALFTEALVADAGRTADLGRDSGPASGPGPGSGQGSGPAEGSGSAEGFGEGLKRYWKGAREVLRQATYYVMKKRAGRVGEFGLGPLLGEVARAAPRLRVHLVGHSMGARLVAYALKGLPSGARPVASVTLLQGAFSHYAFAARLPHDPGRPGALRDLQNRVRGPVVACYSRHDTALGVFYPLASRLAGDSASLTRAAGLLGSDDPRWAAIGHDGVQAVPGTVVRPLATVLRGGVPASGCVSVDTADVVRSHSDICREELARVVVSAARTGR
ncbi:serine-threonine protein kinase [Streptomyces sp. NBC_00233]|uniref:serine-threonine protein kinase n=1 Tax=Streptomyces sp. NBC_00233 TaxID=2975686 RepID=UPI002257709A|nr:serine-threonine protein kinase [Streptomyces sp. NBC_00233]MCX5225222.1 serine-threonine protein kinase [Streptomyces sp. NBC_00233]